MRPLVVTGTGTGVGKTYITRALRQALETTRRVTALKPVESGYDPAASDARTIGGDGWLPPLYAFADAVSPHLAARIAGVHVDLAQIVDWVAQQSARFDEPDAVILVETAGGLLTPLDERGTSNLDLVRSLEPCRWLLVAPNRLGVLHDVRAAVLVAATQHRAPDAVLLSTAPDAPRDTASETNPTELARFLDVPLHSLAAHDPIPPELLARLLR